MLEFSAKHEPRRVKTDSRVYGEGDIAKTFERLDELLEFQGFDDWELNFVDSVDKQRRSGNRGLSGPQLDKINEVWEKYFR